MLSQTLNRVLACAVIGHPLTDQPKCDVNLANRSESAPHASKTNTCLADHRGTDLGGEQRRKLSQTPGRPVTALQGLRFTLERRPKVSLKRAHMTTERPLERVQA